MYREAFEKLLKSYYERCYQAYLKDLDFEERFLDEYRISFQEYHKARDGLPKSVQEAYNYYFEGVERQDWGNVFLYQVPIENQQIYAVYVKTDGDDGWVELYDCQGIELGVGRTYLELVAWGDKNTIRSQTETGDFPPELEEGCDKTLWGK
ncbi:MAG: hypothetical protein SAK29_10000 [Scytonema sp. PMC 1069.18]|nr:hypothetical protein [Scytonema sp. PMC 1069.18]MEC4879875.1 hypothetical protein [Scytonema sp. PMC 1070.18]